MNKRSTKTAAELEQEKFQSVFAKLLQDEENKYCADCSRKQPRWASWNLGVFLCIRCAGIHRNLGVHISKVKSINLDKWTAEQVQNMLAMGNSKGKTVYEATLSDNYIRSQNDAALEVFIRQKYEHKKYTLKNWKGINEEAKDLAVAQSLSEIPNGVQQVSPKTMNTKHIKEDVCLIDFSDSTIQSSKATSNTSWDDMLSDFATAPEFNSKTINSNNINLDTINSNIITSIPPPPGNSDKTINAKSNDILPLFNLPITPSQNLGMNNHIQNVGTNNHLQHLGMNNHIQNFGMNGGATGQNFSSFMSRPTHCQNEIRLPVKQAPTRYDPFADLVCFGGNTSPVVNTKYASNKFETPKVITSAFDPFKDPFNKPVLSAPNIEFSDLLGNGSTVKSDSNGNPNKSTDICSDLDFLQF